MQVHCPRVSFTVDPFDLSCASFDLEWVFNRLKLLLLSKRPTLTFHSTPPAQ